MQVWGDVRWGLARGKMRLDEECNVGERKDQLPCDLQQNCVFSFFFLPCLALFDIPRPGYYDLHEHGLHLWVVSKLCKGCTRWHYCRRGPLVDVFLNASRRSLA